MDLPFVQIFVVTKKIWERDFLDVLKAWPACGLSGCGLGESLCLRVAIYATENLRLNVNVHFRMEYDTCEFGGWN